MTCSTTTQSTSATHTHYVTTHLFVLPHLYHTTQYLHHESKYDQTYHNNHTITLPRPQPRPRAHGTCDCTLVFDVSYVLIVHKIHNLAFTSTSTATSSYRTSSLRIPHHCPRPRLQCITLSFGDPCLRLPRVRLRQESTTTTNNTTTHIQYINKRKTSYQCGASSLRSSLPLGRPNQV